MLSALRAKMHTMKQIGEFLGLHHTTISRIIKEQEEGI